MVTSVSKGRRIGLIGGTYDPIHYGHLVAAEWAKDAFSLEQVVFVPAGDPPHKSQDEVSPASHRYIMTLLGTLNNPGFSVSRIELDRAGKSFTYDTLKTISNEMDPNDELFFIMGADSLAELPTWHRPDDLIGLAQLIVATRPHWDFDAIVADLGPFYERHAERIHRLDIPELGISSQMIRKRAKSGQSIRHLTPDLVIRYINEQGLYVDVDRTSSSDQTSSSDRT